MTVPSAENETGAVPACRLASRSSGRPPPSALPLKLLQRAHERGVRNLDQPRGGPVHLDDEKKRAREQRCGEDQRDRHDRVARRPIAEPDEDRGEPGDQRGDERRRDGAARGVDRHPAIPLDLAKDVAPVVPDRKLLFVGDLERPDHHACVVERILGGWIRFEEIGFAKNVLNIVDQVPADHVSLRTEIAHVPVEQDDFRRESMDVAGVGLEGLLGGVQHQAEDHRRHQNEDVDRTPDDDLRFVGDMPGRNPDADEPADRNGPEQADQGRDRYDRIRNEVPHAARHPPVSPPPWRTPARHRRRAADVSASSASAARRVRFTGSLRLLGAARPRSPTVSSGEAGSLRDRTKPSPIGLSPTSSCVWIS